MIEEHRSEVVEFRLKAKGKGLDWPLIAAEPGEVRVVPHSFQNSVQIEEYIDALRRAAKIANLPDGPEEKAVS